MPRYEYKVVPAPRRGEKARGVKTPEDRFALALSTLMNQLGADGWEYQRAETLPAEERSGFTGKTVVTQNMLIFRRSIPVAAEAPRPQTVPVPVPVPAPTVAAVQPAPAPAPRPKILSMMERPALQREAEPTVIPVRRDAVEGQAPRLGPAKGHGTPD